MLTTEAAKAAIAKAMPDFGSEAVAYTAAAGRVLRQAVVAERDQPPFDRVTMDGIAIRFDALSKGVASFRIAGTQHAGDPVLTLPDEMSCIEVMTGAVLPEGSDCVIPVERISLTNGSAEVEEGYSAERHQFVHPKGSDHRQGTEVASSGTLLTPAEIAIVASCGLQFVAVGRLPVVRVISTGNELVLPGQPVLPHQVRSSNGP